VLGQGEWSDSVSFHSTSPPPNPGSFDLVSSSTTAVSVEWAEPTPGTDDCAIEGYRLLIEDAWQPGFQVVYDGARSSTMTSASFNFPTIRPSRHYKFLL
jgi:hypothetical protein